MNDLIFIAMLCTSGLINLSSFDDALIDLLAFGIARHLVARISWAERLGLGSVEDHSPFGERDFAGRWSRLLFPQAFTGGNSG